MNRLRIFCEGISDQMFLADFIELTYGISFTRYVSKEKKIKITCQNQNLDFEIIEIGGCSKLKTDIWKNELKKNNAQKIVNLIFFDADFKDQEKGNNGYASCYRKLEALKKEVEFEYYIWPDNNSDGEIEDLLISLIPQQNLAIFDCMKNLQNCLASISIPDITIQKSSLKEFINHYYYLTTGNSKLKERDYKNGLFWSILNNDQEYLLKLKTTLDLYVTI